jgi:heme exporter protein D
MRAVFRTTWCTLQTTAFYAGSAYACTVLSCCVMWVHILHTHAYTAAAPVLASLAHATLQAGQRSQQQWHHCHLRPGVQLCAASPQPGQRIHMRARQQLWPLPFVKLAPAACVRGASRHYQQAGSGAFSAQHVNQAQQQCLLPSGECCLASSAKC